MNFALGLVVSLVMLDPSATESEPKSSVVRLVVEPAGAPQPAYRYQVFPDARELTTGNAAQLYLKCFMEQRPFYFSPVGIAERNQYLRIPLSELAAKKRNGYGGRSLEEADRAARMSSIDWQSMAPIHEGVFEGPPAELGSLQTLALALRVRLRVELANQHIEAALRTAGTLFALAQHLGEYPASLGSEVGIWMGHLTLDALEEMVQQPGCPNLYWALSELPSPLVRLKRGVQGDRARLALIMRPIREDSLMTDAELEACVGKLSGMIGFLREQNGEAPWSLRAQLSARMSAPSELAETRQRLIDSGSQPDLVQKLPPLQVILIDEKHRFEIEQDERITLINLPLSKLTEASIPDKGRKADQDAISKASRGAFDALLPDFARLRRNQGLLEQELIFLRHVEALRLHAAKHAGQLPASLGEITVPLPNDPFTDRPLTYSPQGKAVQLSGGGPDTKNENPAPNLQFKISLRENLVSPFHLIESIQNFINHFIK